MSVGDDRAGCGRSTSGRRLAMKLIGLGSMMPLTACGQGDGKNRKEIVLNVVMYSYVDRVITDIIFSGTDLGVANKHGGTGIMTGVRIPYGNQTLEWTLDGPEGMARNGERVKMKKKIVISPKQVPQGTQYIGLHLYPDDTVDITFAKTIPDRTPRGEKILSELKEYG